MELPDSLLKLIFNLAKLPGIGEKTASRLALFILREPISFARDFSASILEVKERMKLCTNCFFISETTLCKFCLNASRRSDQICVVEDIPDLMAIDKTGEYHGLFHVLHGAISPLDGVGPEQLRIQELIDRVRGTGGNPVKEVILATSLSVNGESTAMYIRRMLKSFPVIISRIASGIPIGGDLEYVDQATLAKALIERRTL